ncbi:MAG: DNA repair protein RecN [Moraxella sp.]|nr:DNA repair protein RecN [Moraxella sp.]
MLASLSLHQFALIEHNEISFADGFNVVTGETGAGKSLILDALSLCVGGRADSSMVRHGANTADIYAEFELSDMLKMWFDEHARDWNDGQLLIRRQLSNNGRSKAWINGLPASINELKNLGALLVNIHSQHAGLELLKPQFIIDWLDDVGGLLDKRQATLHAYHTWHTKKREAEVLAQQAGARLDKIDLLTAKLGDIEPLRSLDISAIESEYDELSNREELIQNALNAAYLLDNDEDTPAASDLIAKAVRLCEDGSEISPTFAKALERLTEAAEAIDDAASLLADYADGASADPERLDELNTIISLAHRLSSKHRLPIAELIAQAGDWQTELDELHAMPDAPALQAQVEEAYRTFIDAATALHDARLHVAHDLAKKLQQSLAPLALPNASCEFVFTKRQAHAYNGMGLYEIELLFSANVGMPKQPLHKIASGGELSRMALTMQVMAAGTQESLPLLVFDEVDVGISGGTAQIVGEMLRSLGKHQQLLAITHQAQVAAAAHQHLLVHKAHDEHTQSHISVLDGAAQIDELARMSGGVDITDTTRAHAKSLLTAIRQADDDDDQKVDKQKTAKQKTNKQATTQAP